MQWVATERGGRLLTIASICPLPSIQFLLVSKARSHRSSSLRREAQTPFSPATSNASVGKLRQSQVSWEIISPACPWSTQGLPLDRTCLEHLIKETSYTYTWTTSTDFFQCAKVAAVWVPLEWLNSFTSALSKKPASAGSSFSQLVSTRLFFWSLPHSL